MFSKECFSTLFFGNSKSYTIFVVTFILDGLQAR